ncbi:DUF5819 family protein [Aeromicrobium stalagmiti]|uniref:DUF5819 family protein n=1 Tax=Aeromicrobium stalagmiti TaxID=2738988 RepID=UPI0015681AAE|nr:hypothetical protein [Aeromicrobium stalagmiti]
MPRVSIRAIFIAVVVAIAAVQLVAVTLAALPPNRYSDAAAPRTAYLDPYFAQNWRLFAPAPVSQDREMLFQGSYVADDGTLRRTPWVDWTAVELDLIHHRLVGGRAGYVTNKLYGPLGQRYRGLGVAQRAVADGTDEAKPPSWSAFEAKLLEGGASRFRVGSYLLYERATARLATDVLASRWPDIDVTAVRYRVRSWPVTPYAARSGSEAEREAARPDPTLRDSGWRVPTPGSAREQRAVASFDRRHR